jgi:hypothetical protein
MRRAMSASLSWTACVAATGRPNRMRSLVYFSGFVEAGDGGADRAPGDAVAGLGQAAERTLQALHVRQAVGVRHAHVVEEQRAGDRGAQAHLVLDFLRGEARHALLDQEALDAVVGLRPDDGDIGQVAVGDPHLGAVDHPVAAVALRVVFMFAGSEPPCGSVRPKQPMTLPCRHVRQPALRCSSLP